MMNGLRTFKCPLCKYSVTTREFSSENGNSRTQAARAMNEHGVVAHARSMSMSPLDGQMRHTH
jgi:hypothetical protein